MTQATITFHMPAHRDTALKLQTELRPAEDAYDRYIGEYMSFLESEGRDAGYAVQRDQRDDTGVYSIDAASHDDKTAAHSWLETQPDIWNWIP